MNDLELEMNPFMCGWIQMGRQGLIHIKYIMVFLALRVHHALKPNQQPLQKCYA